MKYNLSDPELLLPVSAIGGFSLISVAFFLLAVIQSRKTREGLTPQVRRQEEFTGCFFLIGIVLFFNTLLAAAIGAGFKDGAKIRATPAFWADFLGLPALALAFAVYHARKEYRKIARDEELGIIPEEKHRRKKPTMVSMKHTGRSSIGVMSSSTELPSAKPSKLESFLGIVGFAMIGTSFIAIITFDKPGEKTTDHPEAAVVFGLLFTGFAVFILAVLIRKFRHRRLASEEEQYRLAHPEQSSPMDELTVAELEKSDPEAARELAQQVLPYDYAALRRSPPTPRALLRRLPKHALVGLALFAVYQLGYHLDKKAAETRSQSADPVHQEKLSAED